MGGMTDEQIFELNAVELEEGLLRYIREHKPQTNRTSNVSEATLGLGRREQHSGRPI